MNLKPIFFGLLFYLDHQINQCNSETITYISTERPVVNWFEPKYFRNVSLFSTRLRRRDPKHYVTLYADSYIIINNTMIMDFYFYQFLTNRYRPSFVEMHFKFCDMINSDPIFGQVMRNALGGRSCPFPPGVYDLRNLSIPIVPKGFPFSKGRIYCNVSLASGSVTQLVGHGSIDMELKVVKVNKN